MTLIVCVDDRHGMMFNKRRQSRDRAVTARISEICEGCRLRMSAYSAPLFEGADILIDDDPQGSAAAEDAVFAEDRPVDFSKVSRLIVYRWQRHYPADTFLPVPEENGFVKESSAEFAGHSHECITEDIYVKRGDGA